VYGSDTVLTVINIIAVFLMVSLMENMQQLA